MGETKEVLPFRPPSGERTTIAIRPRDYSRPRCEHWNVTIDEETRTLECTDCERAIDPILYLSQVARAERGWLAANEAASRLEPLLRQFARLGSRRRITIGKHGIRATVDGESFAPRDWANRPPENEVEALAQTLEWALERSRRGKEGA